VPAPVCRVERAAGCGHAGDLTGDFRRGLLARTGRGRCAHADLCIASANEPGADRHESLTIARRLAELTKTQSGDVVGDRIGPGSAGGGVVYALVADAVPL